MIVQYYTLNKCLNAISLQIFLTQSLQMMCIYTRTTKAQLGTRSLSVGNSIPKQQICYTGMNITRQSSIFSVFFMK